MKIIKSCFLQKSYALTHSAPTWLKNETTDENNKHMLFNTCLISTSLFNTKKGILKVYDDESDRLLFYFRVFIINFELYMHTISWNQLKQIKYTKIYQQKVIRKMCQKTYDVCKMNQCIYAQDWNKMIGNSKIRKLRWRLIINSRKTLP